VVRRCREREREREDGCVFIRIYVKNNEEEFGERQRNRTNILINVTVSCLTPDVSINSVHATANQDKSQLGCNTSLHYLSISSNYLFSIDLST
jgi:hypothetical protein